MSELLTSWFADPTFQLIYLLLALGVLIGPMIWLARWYHANIGKTEGGRQLADWQRRNPPDLAGGLDAAKDIERGDYGTEARRMQHRVYWIVCWWLLAVAILAALAIGYMPAGEVG